MWNFLLDLLFPRRSLLGKEGMFVTEEERRKLAAYPVVLEKTTLRGNGIVYLDRVVAAARYAESPLLRKAIHAWKYRRIKGIGDELGRMLLKASSLIIERDAPTLCPVPLHWTRRFSRGFNQASELAQYVARYKGWQCRELLRRRKSTGSQALRSRDQRFSAVSNAFMLAADDIPSTVVLVDDLSTTGATLDMCAKILKEQGQAKRVIGLVVAQG